MEDKELLETIKKEKVKLIEMQFSDLDGAIKSVTLPEHRIEEALEKGVWFDGSSIQGFTRIFESDMYLKPDNNTFRIIPWKSTNSHKQARIICDVYMPDGKPFEGDPRYILKRAVEKAKEEGYTYYVGPEAEFFLFQPQEGKVIPAPHDVGGYFDSAPRDLASDVRRDIIFSLTDLGLEVEASHHEVAFGQHEIDFKYDEAITTGDNVITFKYACKAIAQAHGLYASFMPKPIFGVNGSGMHIHQSLFKDGKNAFFDDKGKYKLSEIARHYVAGQLKHAKALAAILNPTVNSYKRLVPGYEAPVYISWGQTNRSALIRIPRYSKGRENATRAELRCPDPSCNPYLAFAVMLSAGLDGIKSKLEPPEPVEESLYDMKDVALLNKGIETLPETLYDAIKELEKDKLIRDALGEHTFKQYTEAKKTEWNEYRTQVTKWEIDRYLEII
ncbi:MAG: type I glutamate--ammonia ligase [Candidatus Diapherotrites archaeon CG11_big_fil_rev_8_21_14_0_20_37_9]|nr:MAG: type I glutamate--ammonia ligase [Candidatus Diapherotrites archaeon CG11_big_fil_rev_8_21_14_0_20_37_9]